MNRGPSWRPVLRLPQRRSILEAPTALQDVYAAKAVQVQAVTFDVPGRPPDRASPKLANAAGFLAKRNTPGPFLLPYAVRRLRVLAHARPLGPWDPKAMDGGRHPPAGVGPEPEGSSNRIAAKKRARQNRTGGLAFRKGHC